MISSDSHIIEPPDLWTSRIDREFRVKRDPANTAIMGSSMGGLVSLYAIDEYPKVFGGAGMVSTHWPLFLPAQEGQSITDEEYEAVSSAFERYLTPALPSPKSHKLYFDHGSETLDAVYARYQKRIDAIVECGDRHAPVLVMHVTEYFRQYADRIASRSAIFT